MADVQVQRAREFQHSNVSISTKLLVLFVLHRAAELVVADVRVKGAREFQQISMTAEQWVRYSTHKLLTNCKCGEQM